jgi:hypothetical protein
MQHKPICKRFALEAKPGRNGTEYRCRSRCFGTPNRRGSEQKVGRLLRTILVQAVPAILDTQCPHIQGTKAPWLDSTSVQSYEHCGFRCKLVPGKTETLVTYTSQLLVGSKDVINCQMRGRKNHRKICEIGVTAGERGCDGHAHRMRRW